MHVNPQHQRECAVRVPRPPWLQQAFLRPTLRQLDRPEYRLSEHPLCLRLRVLPRL